ncbi:MAG: C-GCAxxG-C-C family protein [Desulfitobacteriaceae bacterium]
MIALKASELAGEAMQQGFNCCEAVLTAANNIWDLNLSQDTFAAASLFKEGMGSGCTCGALVGMVMASGILRERLGLPKEEKLAAKLQQRFKQEFKSSCCLVLRKNQTFRDRLGNKGCIRLTSKAAALLVEEWENDFRNNSYL